MALDHDSIGGRSHRWRDGQGFAYVWHAGTSALIVGSADKSSLSEDGRWTFTSTAFIQRVYVRNWSTAGPVFYGVNSEDPTDAWDDPADVEAVVRELAETDFTTGAFLFQFESARFIGSLDGQAQILDREMKARKAKGSPIPAELAARDDGRLVAVPPPAGDLVPMTADNLATEIERELAARD